MQNGELTASPQKAEVIRKFKDVCHEWLKAYQLTVRESSWSKTRDCFNLHILPDLGDMYIDQITARDLQAVVQKWYKESPTNFKRYFRHAKRVLNCAEMQDYIPNQRQVVLPSLLH